MQSLSCDLWLMERNAFRQFINQAASGIRVSDETIQEMVAAAAPKQQKSIAIVPIIGAMEARPTYLGRIFGMTSYQAISNAISHYGRDDSVSHIVLDMATPGGMVYGCPECADLIYETRKKKPVIAVVNPMAASGGCWLASAATRVVITPSGDSGSVGVISEHVDISKSLEQSGVKVTVIRSTNSPYKQEGNETEPLTEEALTNMKLRSDEIYQRFVADLAKFRGVSIDHINEHFGKGRLVDARRAVAVGMADRIGTLDDTINRLMEGRIRLGGASAEDIWDLPTPKERRMERVTAFMTAAGTDSLSVTDTVTETGA